MVSARELSRITGILKAPILHHYTESVAGAATVRGFDQQHRFSKANLDLLDQYSRPYFNQFVASEWLNFRFELLSNAVFGCSMLVLLSLPHGVVDPSKCRVRQSYQSCRRYSLSSSVVLTPILWGSCRHGRSCLVIRLNSEHAILMVAMAANQHGEQSDLC